MTTAVWVPGKSCAVGTKDFTENCMQPAPYAGGFRRTTRERVERSQLRKVRVDKGQEVVEQYSLGTGNQATFLVAKSVKEARTSRQEILRT